MGTTSDKLNGILNSKNAIKSAIQNKGITVGDVKFSEYASKINNIPTKLEGFIDQNNNYASVTSTNIFCYPFDYTKNDTSFNKKFYKYTSLKSIGWFNTSNGIDFSAIFSNCSSLYTIPSLNTSNGTNFSSMFNNCLNLIFIPNIDTSNGDNFSFMFFNCNQLLEISNIDTSKGTNFNCMFDSCKKLVTIPELNTSNGINFASMFNNCQSIITIPSLNVSKGTNFNNMFNGCMALKNIGALTGLSKSLNLSKRTLLTHESLLNILNGLATINDEQTLSLGEINLNKLTSDEKQIAINKGWIIE